jgi:hypothetical protein
MDRPVKSGDIFAPNYYGQNVVNLMASIRRAFGAGSEHAPLGILSPDELASPRNVVLLLLDGLGANYLERFPGSFLARHVRGRITTVFPSTTATAVTTFLSGLAPRQHGLVGWFTYLKELGSVAAVLPFRPRHGGPTYAAMGVDPRLIFHWRPLFDQLDARCFIVTRRDIVDSDYSIATGGGAERRAYDDLQGCLRRVEEIVRRPGGQRQYVYAYWPALDAISHQFGVASDAAAEHFTLLDEQISRFVETNVGTDTLMIVCADHGLVDTSAERTVWVEQHPALADMLSLPLCGEPRAAFCHVHTAARQAFEDYVRGQLGDVCLLVDSATVVNEWQWFGFGTSHPQLQHRVGDYTLVMRDGYSIKDRLPMEQPFKQIGVHGGLSAEEMQVPLVVLGM